jgi:lysophospholipase L1-like esterase
VLGDSIAEQGWSCDLLESMLNKNAARLKPAYEKFEVWNAGVSGYDIHHYLIYLEHKGLAYKPDGVIIFFCLNDFDLNMNIYYRTKSGSTGYYFAISEISKIYKVNPFLMAHSYLYRFLVLRTNAWLVNKKTGKDNMALPEEHGRYYLERIKTICAERGIPLFAVIFPYLMPLSEYTAGERYEYETVRKVSRELGVDSLNLYEQLPERELVSLRNIPEDFIHPSPEGHRRIAGRIYEFLLKDLFNPPAQAAGAHLRVQ